MDNTRIPILALAAMLGLSAIAHAASLPPLPAVAPEPIQLAQGADCYAVGQRVAAQHGGTLAKAQPENRGGQLVCVIVILVPGDDGQRPRRVEITEPM